MPIVEQWTVNRGKPEEEITSGHTYGLKNKDNNSYVIYGEREWGINLVWRSNFWRAMWFERQNAPGSPIRYGDRVALAFAYGGEYVRYRERRWGINLVWSTQPVYEWVLTGGPTGSPIRYAGNSFGLFNRVAGDHVVHCQRYWGINLRWKSDCVAFKDNVPATEATVNVNYGLELLPGPGRAFGTVAFSGQLTQSRGATGDGTFNKSDQWEAPGGATFGQSGIVASGLRTGIWRIEARSPVWAAACNVDLKSGFNDAVNFQENAVGCARGSQFPGLAADADSTVEAQQISAGKYDLEARPEVEDLPSEGLDDPSVTKDVLAKNAAMHHVEVDRDIEPVEITRKITPSAPSDSEN